MALTTANEMTIMNNQRIYAHRSGQANNITRQLAANCIQRRSVMNGTIFYKYLQCRCSLALYNLVKSQIVLISQQQC